MQLKEILKRIDVNTDWRDNYKTFVPKFINEAITKTDWKTWDKDIFYEYFEQFQNPISSLKQGNFSNVEKDRIKLNWLSIAPLLKQIAQSQNTPLFDVYDTLKTEILKHTDTIKEAAIHRMVAGLQPNLLSTIVSYKHLNELYNLLKQNKLINTTSYKYDNWFVDSNTILNKIKDALPNFNSYDLITYPWQTLEFLEATDLKQLEMQIQKETTKKLLEYKKQIILQGPPGTGKTKLAKEIAKEYLLPEEITTNEIGNLIKAGIHIYSATDKIKYVVESISDNSVSLLLESGNKQTPTFQKIIEAYRTKKWNGGTTGGDAYETAIAKYIFDNIFPKEQFKLIQFHPAFSYEDFVRGIVAKSNGINIEYKTENKILAQFANAAFDNYRRSKVISDDELSKEQWIDANWLLLISKVENEIALNGYYKLTEKVNIIEVEDDCFRYKGDDWKNISRINFKDCKSLIKTCIDKSLKKVQFDINKSRHSFYRQTYYTPILDEFLKEYEYKKETVKKEQLKNYVLIIDEINRANLPAVLGELIYALEYRGDAVESMYAIDYDNTLILPPNLYIIGTMNTADRSVGHIDYAIRRRFAFVDVLPSSNVIESVVSDKDGLKQKCLNLFNEVSKLFTNDTHYSKEFKPEAVQLGHSYFLATDIESLKLKLEYEIKPILLEYVKDGILLDNESTLKVINELYKIIE